MPRKQFFYFPATNMTNGTTDSFAVTWEIVIIHQCLANGTELAQGLDVTPWSDQPKRLDMRSVKFSTARGAQLADIEATLNSCLEHNGNNSAAIRIANVTTTLKGKTCPVLGPPIKPDSCTLKSAAKELAANVSAAMLQEMSCDERDWRTITAPYQKSMALPQSAGFGVGWLLLPLAFAIPNDL